MTNVMIRDGDLRIDLDFVRRLVLQRFPMVAMRTFHCPDDDVPLMDVFCIPDDRMREFWEFSGEEYSRRIDGRRLQWIGLLPHSETSTREHYPGVCRHARGATGRRRPATHRPTACQRSRRKTRKANPES